MKWLAGLFRKIANWCDPPPKISDGPPIKVSEMEPCVKPVVPSISGTSGWERGPGLYL